jgi:hypothetical protein
MAARHIQEAVNVLASSSICPPLFPTKYTPSKIAVVMHGQQSSAAAFKDLYGELDALVKRHWFHLEGCSQSAGGYGKKECVTRVVMTHVNTEA